MDPQDLHAPGRGQKQGAPQDSLVERKIFKNADVVQQGPVHPKMLLSVLGVQSPSSLHKVYPSPWKQKLAQSIGFVETAVHS